MEESFLLIQHSSKIKPNRGSYHNLRAAALHETSYELHQVVQLSDGLW